jgi:hypothetical protein
MIGRDQRDAAFARAQAILRPEVVPYASVTIVKADGTEVTVERAKAPTHYIPPFTRVNGRQQETVCGLWIREREFSREPTCPACAAWLVQSAVEDAETAKGFGLTEGVK